MKKRRVIVVKKIEEGDCLKGLISVSFITWANISLRTSIL